MENYVVKSRLKRTTKHFGHIKFSYKFFNIFRNENSQQKPMKLTKWWT